MCNYSFYLFPFQLFLDIHVTECSVDNDFQFVQLKPEAKDENEKKM